MIQFLHKMILLLRRQASNIVKWLSWLIVLMTILTSVLLGFLIFGGSDGESLYAFLLIVVPFDVVMSLLLGVAPSGYLYWKQRRPIDRSTLRRSSWSIAIVIAEALAVIGAAVFG